MARFSKDRSAFSISIGPAIPAGQPNENAGRTPLNPGTTTGPGDEFGYVPGPGQAYQFPINVAWEFSFTGGTLTALVVNIEASNDGVTWTQIDTDNTVIGKSKTIANAPYKFFRANIGTFTTNTGAPVVTVGLMF